MRIFPLYLLISLLSVALSGPLIAELKSADRDELATTLEKVYLKWRKAIQEKDAKAWLATTARYTKVSIRNTVVSQKLKFPDAFFDSPIKPPKIDNLTFLGAKAAGQTAQAVFYGKIDFELEDQEDELPNGLLVLRFIKEGSAWKFDTTRMMGFAGMEDLETQIKAGDYSFLEDEAFSPPGMVPNVPKECRYPDKIAHLQLLSIGYDTEVVINGNSTHFVSNNKVSELIIGGLNGGANQLRFRTRPSPRLAGEEAPEREFGIRVVTVDDHAMRDPVEVFKYEPEEGKPAPASFKAFIRGNQ